MPNVFRSKVICPHTHTHKNRTYCPGWTTKLLLLLLLPFYGHFSRWIWVSWFPAGPPPPVPEPTCGDQRNRVFYGLAVLSATQASPKHKALTITRGLTLSFLHPPPDCWRKGMCYLYTISPMPVPHTWTTKVAGKKINCILTWDFLNIVSLILLALSRFQITMNFSMINNSSRLRDA